MPSFVLDSSAVLAVLRSEMGADQVAAVLPTSVLSSVNYAEVLSKLVDFGASGAEAAEVLSALGADVEPVDLNTAIRIGTLRQATRALGLSLGDRACLALAQELGLPAMSADRAWASLDLGVEVVLIR